MSAQGYRVQLELWKILLDDCRWNNMDGPWAPSVFNPARQVTPDLPCECAWPHACPTQTSTPFLCPGPLTAFQCAPLLLPNACAAPASSAAFSDLLCLLSPSGHLNSTSGCPSSQQKNRCSDLRQSQAVAADMLGQHVAITATSLHSPLICDR